MTIYLDVIFLENLIMNYIILYSESIIIKTKVKKINLIISSLLGTFYSIILCITKLEIYKLTIIKILLSIIMVYIAFRPKKIKNILKYLIIFYLTTFLFGGLVFFLIYYIAPQNILIKNGMFIGTYTFKVIIIGGIIGIIFLKILEYLINKSKNKTNNIYEVTLKHGDRQKKLKALLDTGNMLLEPFSGTPVVIVEKESLYEILPRDILNNLEKILNGEVDFLDDEIKEQYISKFKYIPFTSIGKTNGMLLGLKIDKIIIYFEEREEEKENIIIGIYDKSFTKYGEYMAIFGDNIFNRED